MIQFPHTSRAFTLNGKEHLMYKHTLLLLSKIEDESVYVSYADAVAACTNMSESDMKDLSDDQYEEVYESILEFSKPKEPAEGEGGDIKAVELIASLMNKGHMDAQHYRTDFVEVVIKEYLRGSEEKPEEKDGDDEDDNESKMKELFG